MNMALKDVNIDPNASVGSGQNNPPNDNGVNNQADNTNQSNNQNQQQNNLDNSASNSNVDLLFGDDGVPLQNRAKEFERKYEKQTEEVADLKKSVDELTQSVKKQQPNYTVDDYKAFKEANPGHADWADSEIKKLQDKDINVLVDRKIEKITKQTQDKQTRSQTLKYVVDNFSDMFIKNPTTGQLSLNTQSPLAQQVNNIMQDETFKNRPDGLRLAAELAHSRISRMKSNEVNDTNQDLKNQVNNLKNKTLVESGGVNNNSSPLSEKQKAVNQAAKTGSIKDTKVAVGHILRGMNILK